MEFKVEDFAESIGVTCQVINELETKKIKMSPLQYIAIAALADNYFMNHTDKFYKFKEIIDSDGKNYDDQYETSFTEDSLLKRWFEDFIHTQNNKEDFVPNEEENYLLKLARDYKVFLDAKVLIGIEAEYFIENLIVALSGNSEKIIIPLRSLEELKTEVTPDKLNKILYLIQEMQTLGVAQIFGDETDSDFYITICEVFERIREKYKICLITQNEYLAYRILALRKNEVGEREFIIRPAFLDDGELTFYDIELLEDKFEDGAKSNPFTLNPENILLDSDTDAEEKDVPAEDEITIETKKFSTWEEL